MNISFNQNDITHTDDINSELKLLINGYKSNQIFIITDKKCFDLCYPLISQTLPQETAVFILKSEEQFKTIETVIEIWDFLIKKQADRNSLIINIGGGIVSDVGGFAASVYKRGISFINIPTTLLAQIDASVGGKTGINFQNLKNQIGSISLPEKVLISSVFLKTLDSEEFLSGFGEMIKHALIFDKACYYELINFINHDFPKKNYQNLDLLIRKSVNIKIHFVKNDLNETGLRKTLNFGHTFGHAIESYFFKKGKPIKHGKAVIYGIICELWLSVKYLNFNISLFNKVSSDLIRTYKKINIPEKDFPLIFRYMKHDKKNTNKNIKTVLLKDIGFAEYQNIINEEDIFESLQKLNNVSKEI